MKFPVRFICLALALACLMGLGVGALAAEVDCDATYCFTPQDFSQAEDPLLGVCITGLPQAQTGTVMLGSRLLRRGDILTAGQLEQLTFLPLRTEEDAQAAISYLPIYADRVERAAVMTIAIRGKEDKIPVADDSAIETYKNLPNEGKLKAFDPEGEQLTYTLVRAPRRGQVELKPDGTFVYTPKKNKVGVDSFLYTATDPAGNVSRQATVTVQILKPTAAGQYADTQGLDCRFEAEWLRNNGLFVGETVSGESCFRPEQTVSRGEFLAMVVKLLDIPVSDENWTQLPEDTPRWLRPYLAAALRSGLVVGWPESQDGGYEQPITGAEAAVMLQNALDLSVKEQTLETALSAENADVPDWAFASVTVMNENGVVLAASQPLSRSDVAKALYQASILAVDAPGMSVLRMQK